MQFDFRNEMTKRTDEELIQVLTMDRESYLPEALEAAHEEFKKRNLQHEKVDLITKDLLQKRERENIKADEPLFIAVKLTTFVFPLFVTLILSGFYKVNGYDRKARELATWTLWGFCFWALIVIMLLIV